jgi:hypothetical protein
MMTNCDLAFEAKARASSLQIGSLKALTTFAPKAQDLVVTCTFQDNKTFLAFA